MSYRADEAREILLKRIRAEQLDGSVIANSAMLDTFVFDILTKCQVIINVGLRRVLEEYTSATLVGIPIYDNDYFANPLGTVSIGDIVSIEDTDNDVELKPIPYYALGGYSRTWYSDTDTKLRFWSKLGRNKTIITPLTTTPTNIKITAVKITDTFSVSTDTSELPDEDFELVLDLAEVILLQKMRHIDKAKEKLNTFSESYLAHIKNMGVES